MQYMFRKQRPEKYFKIGEPSLRYTLSFGDEELTKTRRAHAHHDQIEVLLICGGEYVFEIDYRYYKVHKGDLVIYNTDIVHNDMLDAQWYPHYGFGATGIQIEGLAPNCLLAPGASPVISLNERFGEFETLFRTLYEQSVAQHPHAEEFCSATLNALLYLILGVLHEQRDVSLNDQKEPRSAELSKRIQAYVDHHLMEDVSMTAVADQFEISQSYLSRIFRQTTGMSLIQYVIARRIGNAQSLLLTTDMPIAEVARAVGYENLSHFTKLFTKNIGQPPIKYRKNNSTFVHTDVEK